MTPTLSTASVAATTEQRIARLGLARPVRNRAKLAANLRAMVHECVRNGDTPLAWRVMALSEAAQWLAAPLKDRDRTGIRAALSDARFYRKHRIIMGRARHAVLA